MLLPLGGAVTSPSGAGPISTTDLWNLSASPSTLSEAAGKWRSLQTAATSAQEVVDAAARQVLGYEAWTGPASEAYDEHRTRLTGDVGELATLAGSVADALDSLYWVLQGAQDQLTGQWEALTAAVPAIRNGTQVTFQPADAGQATAVSNAITVAGEIRAWVDEEFVLKETAFDTTLAEVVTIRDTWQERTVRLVNLNIGSGNDRVMGDKPGVAPEEVDDLAARLDGENSDIVTLQEVYEEDLDQLEDDLEERTGDEWNVHFTEASLKNRYTSPLDVLGTVLGTDNNTTQPFGNAVLVREGDEIAGSETVDDIKLDVEGSVVVQERVPDSSDPSAPPVSAVEDGEGRAAVQAEVTFRE